jgi:uncharacterized protein YndB with AHSA1/START domain
MKWMLVVGVTIAALIALAALVGWRLPRSHRASREQTLAASPGAIWTAITDVEAFPSWRDIKTAQRLPDRDGRPVWLEESRSGRMTLAVERMEAPRLLVVRIADRDLPFGGTWTYEITPIAGGTRLRVTEDGEIYNPLFRFMARFIFGYEGTIASYMAALEKRFPRDVSATSSN